MNDASTRLPCEHQIGDRVRHAGEHPFLKGTDVRVYGVEFTEGKVRYLVNDLDGDKHRVASDDLAKL